MAVSARYLKKKSVSGNIVWVRIEEVCEAGGCKFNSDELEAEMLVSSLAMNGINKDGVLIQTVHQLERQLLQSWDDGSSTVTQAPSQAAVE